MEACRPQTLPPLRTRFFSEACAFFIVLCERCNIAINEKERYTRENLAMEACRPQTFLGEKYTGETVCNSEKNIEKLERSLLNLDGHQTYRTLTSLLSLIFFLAHTLMSPAGPFFCFAHFFKLLRFFSALIREAQRKGFDEEVPFFNRSQKEEIRNISQIILKNEPIKIPAPISLSFENHFDAIIMVDASAAGWAAIVCFPSLSSLSSLPSSQPNHSSDSFFTIPDNNSVRAECNFLLQQKWNEETSSSFASFQKFSAYAEPRAATIAIKTAKRLLKEKGKHSGRKIACITDHSAIVFSQRNYSSFYGGFSLNFFLNELFLSAYGDEDCVHFFYVVGNENLADGPSRNLSNISSNEIRIQRSETQIPPLKNFFYPHLE